MDCSEEEWFSALANPEVELRVDRLGRARVQKSWRLVNRRVPEHYLFFILEEEGVLEVGGMTHHLSPGALYWAPPMMTHSLRAAAADNPFTFYHLRFELLDRGQGLAFRETGLYLPQAMGLERELSSLYDELRLHVPYSTLRFRALLTAFLVEVLRLSGRHDEGGRVLDSRQRRLLMAHMEEVLPGALDARAWAEVVGLSPDYFTRIFRHTYGAAPRTFIMQERMRRARELLQTTPLTVSEVARSCGYVDLFVFSRLFKRENGCSPRHYRNLASRGVRPSG
ncbi:MAG: helix-turn-helix transcriptional regulator [Planctomycetota bacterium]|jgi:AraC-like DNA-binding protein